MRRRELGLRIVSGFRVFGLGEGLGFGFRNCLELRAGMLAHVNDQNCAAVYGGGGGGRDGGGRRRLGFRKGYYGKIALCKILRSQSD